MEDEPKAGDRVEVTHSIHGTCPVGSERRLVEILEEAGRLWAELGKKGTAPGRNYLLKKD